MIAKRLLFAACVAMAMTACEKKPEPMPPAPKTSETDKAEEQARAAMKKASEAAMNASATSGEKPEQKAPDVGKETEEPADKRAEELKKIVAKKTAESKKAAEDLMKKAQESLKQAPR